MSRMLRAAVSVGIAVAGTGYLGLQAAPQQLPISMALAAQAAHSQTEPAASPERALLLRYCVTCHSDRGAVRGFVPISLQALDPANVIAHALTCDYVVRKLLKATL